MFHPSERGKGRMQMVVTSKWNNWEYSEATDTEYRSRQRADGSWEYQYRETPPPLQCEEHEDYIPYPLSEGDTSQWNDWKWNETTKSEYRSRQRAGGLWEYQYREPLPLPQCDEHEDYIQYPPSKPLEPRNHRDEEIEEEEPLQEEGRNQGGRGEWVQIVEIRDTENGIWRPFELLLDSGSEGCLVTKDTVAKVNARQIQRQHWKTYGIVGSELTVTHKVLLSFKGIEGKTKPYSEWFDVVDILPRNHDLLLSKEWMAKHLPDVVPPILAFGVLEETEAERIEREKKKRDKDEQLAKDDKKRRKERQAKEKKRREEQQAKDKSRRH